MSDQLQHEQANPSVTATMIRERGRLVETTNLTKRYGHITAVDHVNLEVRRGEVYGFLGPNGAGKTTTLRMLLGLIRPTSGTARVLGRTPGDPKGLRRIGALIEGPAFYPYLSGRNNLRALARYTDIPESRVESVLAQVELLERADDGFKTYSLGMKQRLGVAAALLKSPDLLILDEPTNGLDPAGMAEMRTLIRQLGSGEHTVLLSSHLLGEVQQICDRIGVINHGKLVAEGAVAELRGQQALLVRATPLRRAKECLERLLGSQLVTAQGDALRLEASPAEAPRVARTLVEAGVDVSELRPLERSLEEVFLEMTGEHPHGMTEGNARGMTNGNLGEMAEKGGEAHGQ